MHEKLGVGDPLEERRAARPLEYFTDDDAFGLSVDELAEKSRIGESLVEVGTARFGSKVMRLEVTAQGEFTCYVYTNMRSRQPGETTVCAKRIHEVVQGYADRERRPMHLFIETKIPVMKYWAATKGEELFHWDNVVLREPPEWSVFRGTVHPEQEFNF